MYADIKYYDLESAINNLQLERYYQTKANLHTLAVSAKDSLIAEVLRLLQYMKQNGRYIVANKVNEELKCILSCSNMEEVREKLDCLYNLCFLNKTHVRGKDGRKYGMYKPNTNRESSVPVFMALYGTSTLRELFDPLNDILEYNKEMLNHMFLQHESPMFTLGGLLSFSVECFGNPYGAYTNKDAYVSVYKFDNLIQQARVILVRNVIKNNEKFLNCKLKDVDSVFAGTLNAKLNLSKAITSGMDYKLEGTTHIIGSYLYIDKEDNKHYDLIQ